MFQQPGLNFSPANQAEISARAEICHVCNQALNGKMFGHQTMFDDVWSQNISRWVIRTREGFNFQTNNVARQVEEKTTTTKKAGTFQKKFKLKKTTKQTNKQTDKQRNIHDRDYCSHADSFHHLISGYNHAGS